MDRLRWGVHWGAGSARPPQSDAPPNVVTLDDGTPVTDDTGAYVILG